ncbi:hypothetical protein ABTF76_22630, partial [Acinetobacter baumannii]
SISRHSRHPAPNAKPRLGWSAPGDRPYPWRVRGDQPLALARWRGFGSTTGDRPGYDCLRGVRDSPVLPGELPRRWSSV